MANSAVSSGPPGPGDAGSREPAHGCSHGKGTSGPRASRYGVLRSARRRQRYLRSQRRFAAAISPELQSKDPLLRPKLTGLQRLGRWLFWCLIALTGQGAGLVVIAAFSALLPETHISKAPQTPAMTVRYSEPPEPEPVAEPEPEPEPAAEKPVPKKPVAKPAPEPERAPQPEPVAEPPPDPVDVEQAPEQSAEAAESKPPPRRIVGLSFESTTQGTGGASFAVGNTRMGTTEREAVDPDAVEKLKPRAQPANTVSSRVAKDGRAISKPKRQGVVEPEYPSELKAQGIEGDVVLAAKISADGSVKSVHIVTGSGYDELDEAAVTAARKQKYSPALQAGRPVSYVLTYTVRFRIDDL